jgi:hypothetical protein
MHISTQVLVVVTRRYLIVFVGIRLYYFVKDVFLLAVKSSFYF